MIQVYLINLTSGFLLVYVNALTDVLWSSLKYCACSCMMCVWECKLLLLDAIPWSIGPWYKSGVCNYEHYGKSAVWATISKLANWFSYIWLLFVVGCSDVCHYAEERGRSSHSQLVLLGQHNWRFVTLCDYNSLRLGDVSRGEREGGRACDLMTKVN